MGKQIFLLPFGSFPKLLFRRKSISLWAFSVLNNVFFYWLNISHVSWEDQHSINLKQVDSRTYWSIQTHSYKLSWDSRQTIHELNLPSLVCLKKRLEFGHVLTSFSSVKSTAHVSWIFSLILIKDVQEERRALRARAEPQPKQVQNLPVSISFITPTWDHK